MMWRLSESLERINELMNVTEKKEVLANLKSFAESLGFDGFNLPQPRFSAASIRDRLMFDREKVCGLA